MIRYLTSIFLLAVLPVCGQNLVPNGSFERSMKPVKSRYAGSIEQASPWFTAGLGSPDLIVQDDVPYGKQQAFEGQQFAGIVLYDAENPQFREYLEVRLTRALQPSEEVCVRLSVSAADRSYFFTDELGIALSDDSLRVKDWNSIIRTPELKTAKYSPIADTSSTWKELSFTYIARGGEQFLTMGNFRSDASTLIQPNDQTQYMRIAYVYIDQVFVGSCKPETAGEINPEFNAPPSNSEVLPAGRMHVPTLVTPNGDGFNDVFYIEGLPRYSRLIIRNKKGEEVYRTDNYRNDWDGTGNPQGTYQYELVLPDGNRIDGPLDVVRRKNK